MNTIPTKSLFIAVVVVFALLAGCPNPQHKGPTLKAKKECVSLTQDGYVSMLVERGKDGCEVDLSETLFFVNNPTCNVKGPKDSMFKAKNIKSRGNSDPECIPVEGLCNDCVKWTRGSSPQTVEYIDETGNAVTICYDIFNGSPFTCDIEGGECETFFCMESVREGNCTDDNYECVPDKFETLTGIKCSAHEECNNENEEYCLWPWESPRTCQNPQGQ